MGEQTATRWEQYNEAGRLFFMQGDLQKAEESFRTALDEAERPGGDRLRAATTLSNLAQLKYQQRALDEAEALFARSIEIRETVLGPEHVSVSQTLNNLAALHVARGRPERAAPLLTRALAIIEKHRPSDHPDVAVTLGNLAKLQVKRGEFTEAEPLLQRLLLIKQATGGDGAEAVPVLASLATVRQGLGRADSAELLWREALALREKSASPTDRSLAPLLEGLSDACATQRKDAEAIAHRQRALEIRLQAFGESHPTVAAARARLADLNAAANAPPGSKRHEPRLSSMRMMAVDDPAELPVQENNAWLMESEPPPRVLDPVPAPVTHAPRPSRPVALRNSELAADERHPSPIVAPVPPAPDAAGVSPDAGIWFAPPPEPPKPPPVVKASEPIVPAAAPLTPLPAAPPTPNVAPMAIPPIGMRSGENRLPPLPPGVRSGEFGPPVQPAGTQSDELRPIAPVARPEPPRSDSRPGPRFAPRPAPSPEPRREPRRERPRREPRVHGTEPELESPAPSRSSRPLLVVATLALLGAGGWYAISRDASAPAPAKAAARAAARVARPVGEKFESVKRIVAPPVDSSSWIEATTPSARPDITVPAPSRASLTALARQAARAREESLRVADSLRRVVAPDSVKLPALPVSLDAAAAATLGVDRVVRAIDDSAKKRVDAALPKVDVKPTDFRKTP